MKRLPDCAHCGKPLTGTGRILFELDGYLGNPKIGWHSRKEECIQNDRHTFDLAITAFTEGGKGIPDAVYIVWKRGSKRVIISKPKTEMFLSKMYEMLSAEGETAAVARWQGEL